MLAIKMWATMLYNDAVNMRRIFITPLQDHAYYDVVLKNAASICEPPGLTAMNHVLQAYLVRDYKVASFSGVVMDPIFSLQRHRICNQAPHTNKMEKHTTRRKQEKEKLTTTSKEDLD